MARYRAKVDCFHNAHLYTVGEEATFNSGDDVPEHFEPVDGEAAEETSEPRRASRNKGTQKPDAGE